MIIETIPKIAVDVGAGAHREEVVQPDREKKVYR